MPGTRPDPMSSRIRTLLLTALLAVPLGALPVGCQGGGGPGGPGKGKYGKGKGRGGKGKGGGRGGRGGDKAADPLPVETVTLEAADLEHSYRASGTLRARRTAEVRSVTAGIVTSLQVEEGDAVEEDQVLARLDTRELKLAASRDSLAAKNARSELDRLEKLEKLDAVSQEEIDKQRYALKEAKASAKLSRAQASRGAVKAPFAGTIIARNVDEGNLASSTTTLFEIADLSELELDLHLPEREAASVDVGAQVELTLLDETSFQAKVIRRAPIVDALTGTVKFTVRASDFPQRAVPGAFTRARILLESREGVTSLPRTAVFELEGVPHVYIIRDGEAHRVPVEVGLEGEKRVETLRLAEAFRARDAVIVKDATAGINEGMAVKPFVGGQAPESPDASPEPNAMKSGREKGKGKGRRAG